MQEEQQQIQEMRSTGTTGNQKLTTSQTAKIIIRCQAVDEIVTYLSNGKFDGESMFALRLGHVTYFATRIKIADDKKYIEGYIYYGDESRKNSYRPTHIGVQKVIVRFFGSTKLTQQEIEVQNISKDEFNNEWSACTTFIMGEASTRLVFTTPQDNGYLASLCNYIAEGGKKCQKKDVESKICKSTPCG
jgi:hypothetical protein